MLFKANNRYIFFFYVRNIFLVAISQSWSHRWYSKPEGFEEFLERKNFKESWLLGAGKLFCKMFLRCFLLFWESFDW